MKVVNPWLGRLSKRFSVHPSSSFELGGRPGSDVQVTVDVPDMKGRLEILKVHAKNKKLDAEVDLESIAARTPGFSGADLANLLNEVPPSSRTSQHISEHKKQPLCTRFLPTFLLERGSSRRLLWKACGGVARSDMPVRLQAAILTGRREKSALTLKEIDDSVDRIVAGMEGTPMVDSKSKSLVAYHEVGHAICATLTPGTAASGVCHRPLPMSLTAGFDIQSAGLSRKVISMEAALSAKLAALHLAQSAGLGNKVVSLCGMEAALSASLTALHLAQSAGLSTTVINSIGMEAAFVCKPDCPAPRSRP